MTTTDWRELCAELLNDYDQHLYRSVLADRARAALATEANGPAVTESREPAYVTGEPTDEELLELMPETMRDEFSYAAKACSNATGGQVKPVIFRVCLNRTALEYARAVLARFGHQPAPPAEGADCPACEGVPKPGNQPCAVCGRSASSAGGEVAELAWWLRSLEDASVWFESGSTEALKLTRAIDLLEHRHPAPVPVSVEREDVND